MLTGMSPPAVPFLPLPSKLDITDQGYLMAIYIFIKNYVSTSPGGSGGAVADKIEPIDNKIEQAMDLVKSHLLLAVREEVDVLKASITKLVDKINVLEHENEVLKTNATAEVLAQLDSQPVRAEQPQQQHLQLEQGHPQQQQQGQGHIQQPAHPQQGQQQLQQGHPQQQQPQQGQQQLQQGHPQQQQLQQGQQQLQQGHPQQPQPLQLQQGHPHQQQQQQVHPQQQQQGHPQQQQGHPQQQQVPAAAPSGLPPASAP